MSFDSQKYNFVPDLITTSLLSSKPDLTLAQFTYNGPKFRNLLATISYTKPNEFTH